MDALLVGSADLEIRANCPYGLPLTMTKRGKEYEPKTMKLVSGAISSVATIRRL
jgi:hypothetical protein